MTARINSDVEVRAAVELRAASGRRVEGFAALFNEETRIGGRFLEVLRPGCFAGSLNGRDVLLLADHDPTKVLSRTRAGSLRLIENGRGLFFEADIAPTSAGDDALGLLRSGNLGGASFGFTVPKGGERWTGEKRELLAVELQECSLVSAWPAYPGTGPTIAARSRAALSSERARRLAWGML